MKVWAFNLFSGLPCTLTQTHIYAEIKTDSNTYTQPRVYANKDRDRHKVTNRPINRQTDKHTHTFTGLLLFSLLNLFGPFWYDSGILSTAVSFTVSLALIALGTIKINNNVNWHMCIYDNR